MESNSFLFSSILLLSSWIFVAFSIDDLSSAVPKELPGGGDVGVFGGAGAGLGAVGGASLPCMKKLLPCQAFLQNPTSPPPSCCVPLKEMVAKDSECLCKIFNNLELLKTLNLTQDQALKLPKACGANADITLCKKDATAPSASPTTPSPPSPAKGKSPSTSPSTPSTPADPADGNGTVPATPATKSLAYGISPLGGYGVITFFMSLLASAMAY